MVAYYQPATLDEALVRLHTTPDLTVIAGGTDVYPAKATRAGWGVMSHPDVLDVSRVSGLRDIEDRGDHWWIGALTTWNDVVRAPLPPLFDGLKAAAREIGGIQIQNRGTFGGNICTASPAGDSIPVLLALDAGVVLTSTAGRRTLPLAAFLVGYRRTALQPGEIVEAVTVPKSNSRGYFLKLGARRYLVISIAMVAATFEFEVSRPAVGMRGTSSLAHPDQGFGPGPVSGRAPLSFGHPGEGRDPRHSAVVRAARIAVGACSAVAQRLPDLERDLAGQPLDPSLVRIEHLAHLAPIDDARASGDYRRAAALQLVRDVIVAAARSAS